MNGLNIDYKPHVYLAHKSAETYFVSISIPVCSAVITSFEKGVPAGEDEKKWEDHDVYVVKISTQDISTPSNVKLEPMPPLQFIGFVAEIKKAKDKLRITVVVDDDTTNGHKKDSIHAYDDASGPILPK